MREGMIEALTAFWPTTALFADIRVDAFQRRGRRGQCRAWRRDADADPDERQVGAHSVGAFVCGSFRAGFGRVSPGSSRCLLLAVAGDTRLLQAAERRESGRSLPPR